LDLCGGRDAPAGPAAQPVDEGAVGVTHVVSLQSLQDDRLVLELAVVCELEVGHTVAPDWGFRTASALLPSTNQHAAAFITIFDPSSVNSHGLKNASASADVQRFRQPRMSPWRHVRQGRVPCSISLVALAIFDFATPFRYDFT
jgi:hypothetical protein